jgi:23S rRNA (uracil1939-C5)-methyltransferase
MKNKVFPKVTIESVAAEGKCVTHIDGRAVFVEGVAPGDIVDLKIIKKKKSYLEARPVHFHFLSEKRAEPFCEHFTLCGGCKWQHLQYKFQVESKRQQIIDNFQRIGRFPFPEVNQIIASSETTHYRNKLEYTFSNKRWLSNEEIQSEQEIERSGVGFHLPGHFDKVVDIVRCYLQREPTNQIRNEIRAYATSLKLTFYDLKENTGLLRNLIVRTTSTDQTMVIVQFGENDENNIPWLMAHIQSTFPAIDSLYYVINLKNNETFYDQNMILYSGKAFIEEKINHLTFKIGPKSFFQTNTIQTEKLYSKVMEMAHLTGNEIVYDLYCGTGTITNFIAQNAKKAIGIESIKEAIDDARENTKLNKIDNSFFVVGDIKDVLDENFISTHGRPDVIVTDPPRAGMHKDVVQAILKLSPARIVYVSCNPATQARDLAFMTDNYTIKEVQPFDMFPHTHHLENIVLLSKKV